MTATHIASMRDIARNQIQSFCIVAQNPFDAQIPNGVLQRVNWQLEFSLLHSDGDQLVGKWRALLISDQSVQKRQTVLTTGNTDGDTISPLKHGESPHGAADQIQKLLFHVHD